MSLVVARSRAGAAWCCRGLQSICDLLGAAPRARATEVFKLLKVVIPLPIHAQISVAGSAFAPTVKHSCKSSPVTFHPCAGSQSPRMAPWPTTTTRSPHLVIKATRSRTFTCEGWESSRSLQSTENCAVDTRCSNRRSRHSGNPAPAAQLLPYRDSLLAPTCSEQLGRPILTPSLHGER